MTGLLAVAAVVIFAAVFATVAVMQEIQDRQRERDEIAEVVREWREHRRRAAMAAAGWQPDEGDIAEEAAAPPGAPQRPDVQPAPRGEGRSNSPRKPDGGRRKAA